MSSLFQNYCDVTESMAFKTSQLNASTSFNTSASRHMIHDRLKCFNCFGIPDKQQFCDQCGGTNFVTDNHPLALLFNDVFQRKLGKTATSKDPVWGDFQDVDTITEQQEELDQRKIICDMCNKECDINYKYFCQCCECFFVCQKCAEQKGDEINHPHPLATNKKLPSQPFMLKKTSSNNYGSNRKSENSSPGGNHVKRNKIDEQGKCTLQFFNVCDIIEKQISHTYGNVAQNISCDPSESISAHEFGMIQSLQPYQFKLLQLQGSDKGIRPTRQNVQQEEKLTKSVNPPSNSFFNYDISIKDRQSIDFNIICQDSIQKSVGNRQSFGFNYETYIQQHCNNCGTQLNDIYTICRTCEKINENYKLCCQCHDKKLFTHKKNHFMEVMLGNLLGRNSQMVSKKLIDSSEQQEVQSPKMNKKRSSLEQRPPRLDQTPFEQILVSGKKSFSKLKSSGSLGMSVEFNKQTNLKTFGEQSVVNLDCEGLFNSTDLSQQLQTIKFGHKKSSMQVVNNSMENIPHPSRFNHAKNKPKVAFAQIGSDDDNVQIAFVQSDSDHEESHHFESHQFQQITIKSSRSSYKGFKSVKSMIFSKNQDHSMISQSHEVVHQTIQYSQSSTNYSQKLVQRQYQSQLVEDNVQKGKQKQQYIFHQYCCDKCGCSPIKNVRYHCLECEDFDVCQNCYGVEFKCNHNHRFQKVDGLKKLMDKKNMMLQKKDLNKGKDSMLRNSNIGLLAKSKKTVDLMKRNVQQLGSSISNLEKSYGSYTDFFSQKFSFKTKVQF